MNGMDIYTLSRLLGHSSVKVTEQAYLDLKDNDIGQRYQRFSPVSSMWRANTDKPFNKPNFAQKIS